MESKSTGNVDSFYVLQWGVLQKGVYIKSLQDYDKRKVRSGNLEIEQPFKMQFSEGSVYYDVIRFQDVFNFAISGRMLTKLENAELSGWDTFDLEIDGVDLEYFGFQVTGNSAAMKLPPTPGKHKGIEIDTDEWDGSDFFTPEGTMVIACSSRVKDFLEENEFSNISLTSFEDYERIWPRSLFKST